MRPKRHGLPQTGLHAERIVTVGSTNSQNRSGHSPRKRYPIDPMKWLIVSITVGLAAAGCKSDAPLNDPFVGRTTIPPPATGAVGGKVTDPYYQPPALTPGAQAAGTTPPAVQIPNPGTSQSPLPTSAPLSLPAASQPSPTAPLAAPAGTAAPPPGGTSRTIAPPQTTTYSPRPTSSGGGANSGLAPRPMSTAPAPTGSRSVQTAPAVWGNTTYTPPAGYQGVTAQTPTATATSSPAASYNTGAAQRTGVISSDRLPGPVDDSASATAASNGMQNRQPMVRTVSPRGSGEPAGRPVDIEDLPNSP
jgi:hypothetical protein